MSCKICYNPEMGINYDMTIFKISVHIIIIYILMVKNRQFLPFYFSGVIGGTVKVPR